MGVDMGVHLLPSFRALLSRLLPVSVAVPNGKICRPE
jgi:hypothetical protein